MISIAPIKCIGTFPLYSNSISQSQQLNTSQQCFPIYYTCEISFINQANASSMNTNNCSCLVQPTFQTSNVTKCKKTLQKLQVKKKQKNDKQKDENESNRTPRKKFSKEEDEKLTELVEKMGSKKWEQIAKEMPGRTGRQCRDRYQNYLIPGFFNGQWSKAEDDLLQKKFMELGSQWSKIQVFFKNRSANSLKNRWNYFVSKNLHIIPYENTNIKNYEVKNEMKNEIKNETVNENENECEIDYILEQTNENDVFKEEYPEFPFMLNEI